MNGKGARGGKPVKLAAPGEYVGFLEADAAWQFIGSPKPPKGMGSTDFFQWERAVATFAQQIYSAQGLSNRIKEEVSAGTWRQAKGIYESFIMAQAVHDGPRANSDKNDPRSLPFFQKQLQEELHRWIDRLGERLQDERLWELDWLHKDGLVIRKRLDAAFVQLSDAAMAVDHIEIAGETVEHEAQTRKRYGRKLKDLARDAGHNGKAFVKAFHIYADAKSTDGFYTWYQRLNETDD
jgi:hypothetical protein